MNDLQFTIELHSEIRKFWEDKGYIIGHDAFHKRFTIVVDGSRVDKRLPFSEFYARMVASYNCDPINYFFLGEFHSEKKMLRLIKLKALL